MTDDKWKERVFVVADWEASLLSKKLADDTNADKEWIQMEDGWHLGVYLTPLEMASMFLEDDWEEWDDE